MANKKDIWYSPEEEIAGKHPFRRLFLDAMVVEESAGLRRVFHSAKKHKSNPLVTAEMPWEGTGLAFGGTVLRHGDKITVRYKCWGPGRGNVCLVESTDGIHFTRPNLGLVEYEGSTDNNICGAHGSIIKIKNPDKPTRQWGFFGYGGKEGAAVSFGETALRSSGNDRKTGLFSTSDVVYFFYDPYQDRYVSTFKTADRRHRAVGIAVSKDALEWEKPCSLGPVFGADDLDPDPTQIYGMPVFPYQGVYIGLPWIYHARWMKWGVYDTPKKMYEAQEDTPCTIDTQFAWSWNLVSWNRPPDRKPFVPLGKPGSWDCEMVATARNPIIVGDNLYFYYGGYSTVHDTLDAVCGGGLAVLRLDGFCSMRAGKSEGSLISRRELTRQPKVTINAVTKANGYVVAEIVDRHNNVIPGFSRKDCVPFTGDSVRHEMTWKKNAFPAELVDADKKYRFFLKDADLYSYLPADIDTKRDTGKIP